MPPSSVSPLPAGRAKRSAGTRIGQAVGVGVKGQQGAEGRQGDLSTLRARLRGLRLIRATRSLRPTMIPAWGPPSSLSPLKVTRSAPAFNMDETVGYSGRPYFVKGTSVPLPRSTTSGKPCFPAMPASRFYANRRGESLDRVVAGMCLQDEAGLGRNGVLVVGGMGPVRGAHLAESAAGAGHDIGQAKRVADFDQLAPRHDYLPAQSQTVEDQQHGGGVVVHHRRSSSAGQAKKPPLNMAVTVPAATAIEIVFHVGGPGCHRRHRRDGFPG